MEVNTAVSPSLHPSNVTAIEGYNDETAESVADVLGAFTTAYESLTSVHLARKAAGQNPALNESAQVLAVADFADKHSKKITTKFDAANARLTTAIADGERQLRQPLEGAAVGGLTAEIRAHVKTLSQKERMEFMNEAVRAGDTKTLAAVLGAPSYLSGISAAECDMHVRGFHERANPSLAKRLVVMKAAQALIHERGSFVLTELEKAIGTDYRSVAHLRAARAKAEKAYNFTA